MDVLSVNELWKSLDESFVVDLTDICNQNSRLLQNFRKQPQCICLRIVWTLSRYYCLIKRLYLGLIRYEVRALDLHSKQAFVLQVLFWNLSWICVGVVGGPAVVDFKLVWLDFSLDCFGHFVEIVVSSLADSLVVLKKLLGSAHKTITAVVGLFSGVLKRLALCSCCWNLLPIHILSGVSLSFLLSRH